MTNKIFFPQHPVEPLLPGKGKNTVKSPSGGTSSFQKLLDTQINQDLKFSHHAQQRLKARDINLSEGDLEKITQAVEKARDKGARDSLVLMNNLALVVSVKNNTVITAVDEENLKENVFTNIDSAVII